MLTNDRNAYRNVFFISWQKYQKKLPLDAEEQRLIAVILEHPEYHSLLDDPATHLQQEYMLEENPFLHMSLHVALRDQIRINHPNGIKVLHESLIAKYENSLHVEHLMMQCLVSMLKKGQESGTMPDDKEYLTRLSAIK